MNAKLRWPFAKADNQSKDYAATVGIDVTNSKTLVTVGTASGAFTVNANIDAEIEDGAELFITTTSDTTARTVTWGTGFTAPALSGTISKSKLSAFVYDKVTGTFKNVSNQTLS